MRAILLLAILCATAKEEGCRIFCTHEGFDGGLFKKEQCLCFNAFDYNIVGLKRVGKTRLIKDDE